MFVSLMRIEQVEGHGYANKAAVFFIHVSPHYDNKANDVENYSS